MRGPGRCGGLVLGLLATGISACASSPSTGGPAGLPPLPSSRPADPAPQLAALSPDLLRAARSGEGAGVRSLALETVGRCGLRPLGQQALLLLAATELDPRNPHGRPSLALEATRLVAEASEPEAWTRILSESLHLLALRLGARPATAETGPEAELRARARDGATRPIGPPLAGCAALPWPDGPSEAPGPLPELQGPSYPARIAWLERRVEALESELRRLRRITAGEP